MFWSTKSFQKYGSIYRSSTYEYLDPEDSYFKFSTPRHSLHKYVDARHKQYGPIFRERLGGTQDAVFVSSANLMRGVFQHEGQYPQHPLPDAWTLYNQQHACQRGLFFM